MSSNYEVPGLAAFFHSFPRLDLTFQPVNSTFTCHDERYNESLLFWAAVPVLWLLLTLLVFLIYFCYRCCQRDVEKGSQAYCLRWSLAILAIFTCAVLGVALYGNEEAKSGLNQAMSSTSAINLTGDKIVNNVAELKTMIDQNINNSIDHLRRINNPSSDLELLLRKSFNYSRDFLQSIGDIGAIAQNIRLPSTIFMHELVGFYRWVATMAFLGWGIFLCFLLLLSIGLSSRCTLLVFCTFGILTMVICWVFVGVHLGTCVMVSDFCMDPYTYVEEFAVENLQTGVAVDSAVIEYYVNCGAAQMPGLIKESLYSANMNLPKLNESLNAAFALVNSQLATNLSEGMEIVQTLTALVECNNIHRYYRKAVEGICYVSLPACLVMMASAACWGLLLSLMIVVASRAWRHFGKSKPHKGATYEVNPYAHDPDISHQPTDTFEYRSYTRGSRGNPREHLPMLHRTTPPPAYNSNEFYRTYSDMHNTTEQSSGSRDSLA